jgi:hypothetical protein
MLPSLLHLTQLESLSLGMDETVDNCCYTDCCALPKVVRRLKHLHTLHIPDCPVFGNRILDALLEEAPQLTNLSVSGVGVEHCVVWWWWWAIAAVLVWPNNFMLTASRFGFFSVSASEPVARHTAHRIALLSPCNE